jgi:RNA polymerase sigma factor (sigma-70 family)
VWLELYRHLSDLRHVEALPAWLITVTRRISYKTVMASRGTEQLDDDLPDVKQQLAHIEHEHSLERALEQLPDRCRRLIDLLYFDAEEPSYSKIAETMQMPEASIGPTRARCLEKLRRLMD